MNGLEYGPMQEEEIDAFQRILSQTLHFFPNAPAETRRWIQRRGIDAFRVVREQGRVIAGLQILEMGQWFGGVSVPAAGIAAVGVLPEHRGRGIASFMLCRMLEEVRAAGFPLSTLFPATLPVYRRAGYERAGLWTAYELAALAIQARDRTLDMVPAAGPDDPEFVRLYTLRARQTSGNLDRPDWMWRRLQKRKDTVSYSYLIARNGHPEGYVVFTQGSPHDPLRVFDLCVLTREAGLRLLTFFADHRSRIETITWNGGPHDPLLYLLSEQMPKIQHSLDWMLRIVGVEKALAARGYPPDLRAEMHLEVLDEVLPWNHGRFVLEVAKGRAEVRPGGSGDIRLSARGLAALYSGHLTPPELRVIGSLDGPDPILATLGLVFSGPRPWMPDMF